MNKQQQKIDGVLFDKEKTKKKTACRSVIFFFVLSTLFVFCANNFFVGSLYWGGVSGYCTVCRVRRAEFSYTFPSIFFFKFTTLLIEI